MGRRALHRSASLKRRNRAPLLHFSQLSFNSEFPSALTKSNYWRTINNWSGLFPNEAGVWEGGLGLNHQTEIIKWSANLHQSRKSPNISYTLSLSFALALSLFLSRVGYAPFFFVCSVITIRCADPMPRFNEPRPAADKHATYRTAQSPVFTAPYSLC